MIHKMFAIYDEKAEAYLQPFFMPKTAMAIRTIINCINDPDHSFNRHTSDFTLFMIGEFDDTSAQFHEMKKSLGNLVEYKTQGELFTDDEKQLKLTGGKDA